MRSDTVKKGFERAPHRSLLKATGNFKDGDEDRPFIAVVNSYVDIIPGHTHLAEVGEFIKQAVREAGGVPFVFNTIGVDDGIAMGHVGHEVLAAQPRPDRRLGGDDDRGAPLRRDDLHPELRQDRAGNADGGDAVQHPVAVRQRRADGGGQDPRRAHHGPDHRVRGRRRVQGGQD